MMLTDSPENPIDLFNLWYHDAQEKELNDPNAMSLATVGPQGYPSVRMVLLKDIEDQSFVFYTNLESRKGTELLDCSHVALCFHWKSLRRQVRIEGDAVQVHDDQADQYFATRPLGSQIGAWASKQSRHLVNREDLKEAMASYTHKFGDEPVPRPPFWSGFAVSPRVIEFWEEQPFRLHNRLVYKKEGTKWSQTHLYP